MKTKIVVLMVLIFTTLTVAQPFGRHQRGPKERIEELARIKILETLDLNEEDAVRFFTRRKDFLDRQKGLMDQRDGIMLEMEIALKKEKTSEDYNYKSSLDKLAMLEEKIAADRENFLNSLSDLLSIEQIAKLVIFESKFREELRNALMGRNRGGK